MKVELKIKRPADWSGVSRFQPIAWHMTADVLVDGVKVGRFHDNYMGMVWAEGQEHCSYIMSIVRTMLPEARNTKGGKTVSRDCPETVGAETSKKIVSMTHVSSFGRTKMLTFQQLISEGFFDKGNQILYIEWGDECRRDDWHKIFYLEGQN